jgi:ectoine hydroxylase-related dioxygenase (phytanoyl-CoA dioxygenase family)
MLTQAEIRQYHEDGYVVPSFTLPDDVLAAMDERVAKLLNAHPEYRDNCPALLKEDMGFAQFCLTPGIIERVAELIGPDVALWNMSLFAKPARNGLATPWHQDGEYWPIRPLATCSVWIALDDSTPENGCLRIIRGSHKARRLAAHHTNPSDEVTLHQELDADTFDEKDAVDIVLKRGQISLHDVYLMHGSEPNRSSKPRRGMTMRMMPTTSHYDREVATALYAERRGTDMANHPVLLLHGEDRCGHNQFTSMPA